MQKGQTGIFILLGILLIIGVATGAFYLQSKEGFLHLGRISTQKPQSQTPTKTPLSAVGENVKLETFRQGWIKELKYPLDKYSLIWPDETYIGSLYNSRNLLFQPIGVTLRPNDQYTKQNPDDPPPTLSIFVFHNKDNLTLSDAKGLSERYGYISPGYLGFEKGAAITDVSIDGLPGIRLDVDCNGEGCFPGSEVFIIKQLNQPSGTISSVIFRFTIIPSLKEDDKNKEIIEDILASIKLGP